MTEPTLDEQVAKIRAHVADELVTEIHANCCRKLLAKIDELDALLADQAIAVFPSLVQERIAMQAKIDELEDIVEGDKAQDAHLSKIMIDAAEAIRRHDDWPSTHWPSAKERVWYHVAQERIDELTDRNELLEADAAHWRPDLTARISDLQACLRRYVAAAEKDHFPGKDAEHEAARLLKSS